ncbi:MULTISPECIES: hypothetical protein [unclassified Streptomyces]|uniref:hypothetical protein n=1 Tax=unclassified Streptomyces TaxID=2593676 RepID=UPI002E327C1B|nr:hypothetical protein [Streptomyces sp. NBC_01356]
MRRKSSLNRDDRSPPQSLHARYFSTIQASSPVGESASLVRALLVLTNLEVSR